MIRNPWQMKLDVSDVFRGEQPWPERRDEMVRRVRNLPIGDSVIDDVADALAEAQTPEAWDAPWDEFYDVADAYGVWVVTR